MKNVSGAIIYVVISGYFLNLLVRERVLEMLFGLLREGDRLRVGGRERDGVRERVRLGVGVGERERVRLGVGVGERDGGRGGMVGVFVIDGLGDEV